MEQFKKISKLGKLSLVAILAASALSGCATTKGRAYSIDSKKEYVSEYGDRTHLGYILNHDIDDPGESTLDYIKHFSKYLEE